MQTRAQRLRLLHIASILVLWSLATVASAQSVIRSNFDHDSTGFRLDGAHLGTSCGNCHSDRILSGTLRECEDCHTQGTTVEATAKPARHILASDRCEACHATRSFIPLQRMDHYEVFGECVSCHNNQTAPGKPVNHVPAGDNCEDCHLTVAFRPAVRFDHTQALGTCSGCHNGVLATGQDADHIQTTAECDACHSTVAWR